MAGVDLEDLAGCSQTLKPAVTGGVMWGPEGGICFSIQSMEIHLIALPLKCYLSSTQIPKMGIITAGKKIGRTEILKCSEGELAPG